MGENNFQQTPVVVYGLVLFMCATAYYFLVLALLRRHDSQSVLARAVGRDKKGKISMVLYIAGIGLTYLHPWLGVSADLVVACIWFIPDTRIESQLEP